MQGSTLGRSLSRLVGGAALVATTLVASGLAQTQRVAGAVPVNADPAHPIMLGLVGARATQPARRIEIVLAIQPRNTLADNAAGTAALLRFANSQFPNFPMTEHINAPVYDSQGGRLLGLGGQTDGAKFGGYVRITMPTPIGDAQLRNVVSNLARALAVGDRDPPASASIAGIPRTSCDATNAPAFSRAIDTVNRESARRRVAAIVSALGDAIEPAPQLEDVTRRPRPIDDIGLPPFGIECGYDEHGVGEQNPRFPTRASFDVERRYSFVQHIRFASAAPASTGWVPDVLGAPLPDLPVRLRASGPLLVLEGTAAARAVANGTRYDYVGAASSTETTRNLDVLSRRLRSAGVRANDAIVQFDPQTLGPHVIVYNSAATIDDRIVTALAGTARGDRAAVLVAPTYDRCRAEAHTLVEAVAGAADRARRIAALIGTTANPQPVIVSIEHATMNYPCDVRARLGDPVPAPEAQRQASGFRATPLRRNFTYLEPAEVLVAFRIGKPSVLTGKISEASANENGWIRNFALVAPPIQYPEASIAGQAALEMTLQRHAGTTPGALSASDGCLRNADRLARDTIRAAVRHAKREAGARLIAIDLRGPFAVDGTCDPAAPAEARSVRIAAFARASFGP